MQNRQQTNYSSRRDFLRSAGAAAAIAGIGALPKVGFATSKSNPPLTHLSAKTLAKLIADREVSAVEVVEAHLKRIKEVNPKLNAIVQMDAERIRAEARQADKDLRQGVNRGPLQGVPFTMKDQMLTKGIITTNGCPELRSYVPTEDATVVKRLKDAGGILLGKTNVPEMCYHGGSDNLVYGRTNNPYDGRRTPGGSSGGEAAIIAACGSPFGLGSDIGNSIRAPAHFCGIAGIKPTCRLVPETGLLNAFPSTFYDWNCIGPMARHVEDLEFVLQIISGPDGVDPYVVPVEMGRSYDLRMGGLRVALCTDDGATKPTKETMEAVQRAAKALRESGANVVEARPPRIDQAQDIWIYNILPLWLSSIRYYPKEYAKLADSKVAEKRHFSTEGLLQGLEAAVKESDFGFDRQLELLGTLQQYREEMMRFIGNYDAILSPVTNQPAWPHPDPTKPQNDSGKEDWASIKARTGGFCVAYNLTGWPAAVVRAGTSPEGLPIGVQIAAKPWKDNVALAVAGVIENKLGGWKPPSL